jgi:AbrB family looped-hinge helix DNA binding protein
MSSKGQIVIPKPYRDALNLKTGSLVLITMTGKRIIIIPKPADPLEGLVKAGEDISMATIRKDIKPE